MPLSQEVEKIFKLRSEFKECRKAQDAGCQNESSRCQEVTAKIADLIKKIKE